MERRIERSAYAIRLLSKDMKPDKFDDRSRRGIFLRDARGGAIEALDSIALRDRGEGRITNTRDYVADRQTYPWAGCKQAVEDLGFYPWRNSFIRYDHHRPAYLDEHGDECCATCGKYVTEARIRCKLRLDKRNILRTECTISVVILSGATVTLKHRLNSQMTTNVMTKYFLRNKQSRNRLPANA